MSVGDAQALKGEDLDATRIPSWQLRAPDGDTAAGETGPTTDSDATRLPQGAAVTPAPASRPPESSNPFLGRVLGKRYLLEQELGAGGMGAVYRATDLQVPGEVFAIKVLKPKYQGNRELVALLREEVRKTRMLSHPNVVGAYSINSDEDGDYMLMEYLEGETLQKLLDEEFGRGIPLARAWPLISDTCAGLACAHDHNVIHSDLKPSNVFLTKHGKIKLLDFGIARVARGPIRGADPAALGAMTVHYASCEMLDGGTPDVRDDIYALGCVVYEMLSGKHPFSRKRATEARDLKLEYAPLAPLTRRQNAALAKALSFDREKRFASVEAFQSQFQPQNRNPWTGMLLSGGMLAVLIAGVALYNRKPSESVPEVTPVAPSELQAIRALGKRAEALDIDPSDSLLRVGLRALDDAQARVRAGTPAEAKASMLEAQRSLEQAIRLSPRIALVGSGPDEIASALQLCRQETGNNPDCKAESFADENVRKVTLAPFALDAAPATNAEFAQFASATGYVSGAERANGLYAASEKPEFLEGWSWQTLRDQEVSGGIDRNQLPVRGIDYETAKEYCAWRHKRLPAEDEWEYAARGPARKAYPWGDKPEDALAARVDELPPVGQLPGNGYFGGRGLGGGIWEWADGSSDSQPILRGPSYLVNLTFYQRLATRQREDPQHARVDTGVRCAVTTEAWPNAAN